MLYMQAFSSCQLSPVNVGDASCVYSKPHPRDEARQVCYCSAMLALLIRFLLALRSVSEARASREAEILVKPETVLRWHRRGFRAYWRWKSWRRRGRPRINRELRSLIRRMSKENPTWGAPRIDGELLMLGIDVSESARRRLLRIAVIHVVSRPARSARG